MAGLLDFLFQGNGGGLLGLGGPQQINPAIQQQQQGMMPAGYPGGMDPMQFANQATQQQGGGLLFNPNQGLLGGIRGALGQIADPQQMQRQQAIQNYIQLKQLGIQEKAAEEKPQYQKITRPDGTEGLVLIQPFGKGVQWVNPVDAPGAPSPGRPPNLPANANVKVYNEKIAADAAANEQEAVKSAKAAADLKPVIDEAAAAYEAAHKLGAIGPVAGSGVGRFIDTGAATIGRTLGLKPSVEGDQEAARQRYDRAQAALQARATQAQNAGQGAVSNYERELFAKPIPNLTALDPGEAMNVFKQMQAQTEQTVKAGRIPALGQAPQVGAVLDRPSIPNGLQPGPQIAPPTQPIKVQSKADYDRLPPNSPYVAPDGSIRTKQGSTRLNSPNPIY